MNHLTKEQCMSLRAVLMEDQARIEERLAENDHYGMSEALSDYAGELSSYDNHPADVGTETYERGKDLSLLENDERRLRRIHEALQAMEDGEYGVCRTCHSPIPFERLEAVPETRYCVTHSPQQHPSIDRPVEEEFLAHPFGRSSMDEESSYAGFDGEDAWQIVEGFGNSDSPAMAENPDADYERLTIEPDEHEGFVESIESFLATDITGSRVSVVRNRFYREYMSQREGDPLLEPDELPEDR